MANTPSKGSHLYGRTNEFDVIPQPFEHSQFAKPYTKTSNFMPTPPGISVDTHSPAPTNIKRRRDSNVSYAHTSNGANNSTTIDSKELAPGWTDLKTKAGKDRKRLPLACIACRRKKVRCSGEKPACKHCLKSRQPCVYKVTARKAAPRTDYMAMLDKRLKRMEDRVLKVIPKDEMQNLPEVARAIVKPSHPGTVTKSVKKRSAEEAFTAGGAERPSELNARVPRPQSPRSLQAKQAREESSLLTEGKEHLPSDELQHYLANVYFDYVYGQSYHLLHKPSFMRRLEAGTIPPVLMLAVCAVSARFANHPQLRTSPAFLRGDKWAKASLEIALRRFDSPNIATLTVFLLLGLHTLGTCQGGQSWMLGGMAHRMAYALRLHEELVADGDNISCTDREIRRRTMWSCFMMDRFMSSGTERPMFTHEKYISVQLPIKERLFQMEIPGPTEYLDGSVHLPPSSHTGQMTDPKSTMGVGAYTMRIISVWGHLIRYFNQRGKDGDEHPIWSAQSSYRKLYSQVEDFRNSLPDQMQYNDENIRSHSADGVANQFLFMHIIYHHCVILFNEFAVPTTALSPPPKDIPPQFLLDARKVATDSATAITRIIERGFSHRLVAPFAGYCTYVSSAIHIYGAVSRNSQLEETSKECLRINIKYLSQMKECWGMFVYMVDRLRDLYQLRADTVAKGILTPNARLNQKAVFQYGDWYDRYPNGVSKNDYEEPESNVKKEEGDDAVLSQRPIVQSVDDFFANLSPSHPRAAVKRRVRRKSGAAPAGHAPHDRQLPDMSSFTHGMDHLQLPLPRSPFGIPESYDRSPILPQPQPHHPTHQQQHPPPSQDTSHLTVPQPNAPSQLDPFSFQPIHQPHMVPHLDRQLVLASWNGIGPSASLANPTTAGAGASSGWDTNDMNSFNDDMLMPEPSNAWFMPFNIDPRDFGGEQGGYAGQGFGGMGGGLGGDWYADGGQGQILDGSGNL